MAYDAWMDGRGIGPRTALCLDELVQGHLTIRQKVLHALLARQ